MPIFDDCMFALHKKYNVHRDAVISTADEKALQKGEDLIVTVSGEFY